MRALRSGVPRHWSQRSIQSIDIRQRAFATETAPEPAYASKDLTGFNVYSHETPFVLDSGSSLESVEVAYESWGTLNHRKDNTILLHCGMSASSHAKSNLANQSPGWWEGFIGPGLALDTNVFFVICSNNLGGCYGTTGPSSTNPATGAPYGGSFPMLSVQDMVRAQFAMLDSLGIERLHASVGASLGGMQSTCAAAIFPERVGKFVSISACARSFPGSIAFRYTQRQAVMSDPNWNGGDYYGEGQQHPDAGLKLAREVWYRQSSCQQQ
jgi:homoserine O-acetyltransferase